MADKATSRSRATAKSTDESGVSLSSYTGEAYCVKCKEKRDFTRNVEETNGCLGRPARLRNGHVHLMPCR